MVVMQSVKRLDNLELMRHTNAGFAVPQIQFANWGAANHPGVSQSSWNSCFSCGHAVNYCTQVAGSPNTTDQFSLYRGDCQLLLGGAHT